ncbi:MAG: Spc98 family-domain-containing protein [Benjaminiella poitrasii]|nr:MAG: Spc98 family-domain-containing protein [Benjaminiella poitrasii]
MFQSNLEDLEYFDFTKLHGESINVSEWKEEDQLRLRPLTSEPFSFLNSNVNESFIDSNASVTTTITTVSADASIQQDDVIQEEENDMWTEPPLISTTFNTLSWDTQNSYYPSYAQHKLARKNVSTPFLTEAPQRFSETIIHSLKEDTTVVYESDLVKSLVQALNGLPSIYFYWDNCEMLKQRNPRLRILGVSLNALQPILEKVLLFSSQLRALESVAIECQDNAPKYGLTGTAFGCYLSELHLYLQHSIVNVLSLSDRNHPMTILKLYQYIQPLSVIVQKLYTLLKVNNEQHKFEIPFGAALLNLLYEEIRRTDLSFNGNMALYRDICLTILIYTSEPYQYMLSRWLQLCQSVKDDYFYEDPYHEFFIDMDSKRDVLHRFQIRADATLPYFIDKDLSEYIFRSGVSLRLLRKTKPEHPIFYIKDSMSLKCILTNTESEKYLDLLRKVSKYIQSYNLGNHVTTLNPLENLDYQQKHTSSLHDNNNIPEEIIPTLPLLGKDLVPSTDFINTLSSILNYRTNHSFIPTLDVITLQSYLKPFQIWCPILNESVMSSFLDQFKLQSHLSLMYHYFLFGNGTFVNGLKTTLFSKQEGRVGLDFMGDCWPPRVFELQLALRDLLLDSAIEKEDELITFRICKTTKESPWLNPRAVEALDFLQLDYNAAYPLNMVITSSVLDKYNRIFTFLLRLLRVTTVLKRSFERLKNITWFRAETRDRLYRYRFQMDQFVNAFQGYVQNTAIQNTWNQFMQHVQNMRIQRDPNINTNYFDYVSVIMEPHSFRDYHEHILDRILYQCFLKQSQTRILQELLPVLYSIISFGALLDDYLPSTIEQEDKLSMNCRRLFERCQSHSRVFINVLMQVESKGSGSLGNILNSTRVSIFNELYARHEAKQGLDGFVKDLLARLNLNSFNGK